MDIFCICHAFYPFKVTPYCCGLSMKRVSSSYRLHHVSLQFFFYCLLFKYMSQSFSSWVWSRSNTILEQVHSLKPPSELPLGEGLVVNPLNYSESGILICSVARHDRINVCGEAIETVPLSPLIHYVVFFILHNGSLLVMMTRPETISSFQEGTTQICMMDPDTGWIIMFLGEPTELSQYY